MVSRDGQQSGAQDLLSGPPLLSIPETDANQHGRLTHIQGTETTDLGSSTFFLQ